MDIGSLNSLYLNNVKNTAQNNGTDITDKLKNGMDGATDRELMDACKEFEAYFIEQIFKNMKKSMVPSNDSTDAPTSMLKEYYEDELMSKYASTAADQSTNGLARMLYEQMKRNQGTTDIKDLDKVDDIAVANASSAVKSEEE